MSSCHRLARSWPQGLPGHRLTGPRRESGVSCLLLPQLIGRTRAQPMYPTELLVLFANKQPSLCRLRKRHLCLSLVGNRAKARPRPAGRPLKRASPGGSLFRRWTIRKPSRWIGPTRISHRTTRWLTATADDKAPSRPSRRTLCHTSAVAQTGVTLHRPRRPRLSTLTPVGSPQRRRTIDHRLARMPTHPLEVSTRLSPRCLLSAWTRPPLGTPSFLRLDRFHPRHTRPRPPHPVLHWEVSRLSSSSSIQTPLSTAPRVSSHLCRPLRCLLYLGHRHRSPAR